MDIVKEAHRKRQSNLSEYEAKRLLQVYGIPIASEALVRDGQEAIQAARKIGYPVVVKVCSSNVSHKTERGLIEVDLRSERELLDALDRLQQKALDPGAKFLVQDYQLVEL